MVAGVAHEINNPINFVVGNLKYVTGYVQELIELVQIYQEDYPEHTPRVQNHLDAMDLEFLVEDLPKTLNSMAVGTDRLNDIVLALRNFSRLDQAETQTADVHAGIDSTLLLLNHRIKKQGVEIIKQYGDLPQIECYPAQLNQVFMNILSNAIDALAEVMETQKQHITIASQLKKSRWVEISIQDNGPGISAENMEKLFDSFFTTKPVGKGTGLGLSIAQQIIERHNGTIEAFSEKEKGTKFVICLPIEQ
ncbi:MAG: ATP-binding protein [Oculatellaceae cyanobacterium Prado106]|nr:ATP-binding protein [Oculatellaceae cyanobacterium Prado106]